MKRDDGPFFQRRYPSANCVLLDGPRPVLVDTGFGSDADEMVAWLGTTAPTLIVNTHFHTDHVGGNRAVQRRFDVPIAASAAEAAVVNRHDPDCCEAHWLQQPIEPYEVAWALHPGDLIDTGAARWAVVDTPGHTFGHISLHCAEAGLLVLGDALHGFDIGWLSPRRPEALDEAAATLALLARLPAATGYSGHGPAIADLPAALARGRRRIDAWRNDPHAMGWHACKRIFTHALMLADGMAEPALTPYLLGCPWFHDHARLVFGAAPDTFAPMLIDEMVRSAAAMWQGGKLVPRADYRAPRPDWLLTTRPRA